MKTTIMTEKNVELTPSDKDLIEKKLVEKLDKLLDDFEEDTKDATIKITYFNKDEVYKINFDMWLPGKEHVYAEESHEVLLSALTGLREDLEIQIKKYKDEISNT